MENQKIRFDNRNQAQFYKTLSAKIRQYFLESHQTPYANWKFWVKIILLQVVMWGVYALILSQVLPPVAMFGLGIVFTTTALLFGFNLAHDASHDAISSKKWVNKLLVRSFDIIGISSYLWIIKHCGSHHRFTNVPEYDADIGQQKLIRLTPTSPLRWHHRFQFIYAPLVYMNFSLFLVYVKDFIMLSNNHIASEKNLKHPVSEILFVFISKAVYTTYSLVIPLLVLDIPAGWIVFCFIASHWVASLIAMMILLPVHLVDSSEFTFPDEKGNIDTSWAIHQVAVTQDFSTSHGIAGWFFGGLNFHIVHHMFPTINHIHFPALTKIIKDTAAEFNVKYVSNSWSGAILKHFRFLKKMGLNSEAYVRNCPPQEIPHGKSIIEANKVSG